jgi:hypothetical protein
LGANRPERLAPSPPDGDKLWKRFVVMQTPDIYYCLLFNSVLPIQSHHHAGPSSPCSLSLNRTRYILCILVLNELTLRLLYSRLASVSSVPPTFPHPASGTTMQLQLSSAPRSSAKLTMVVAARWGSCAFRARSMISWLEIKEETPSVTKTM